MNLAFQYKEVVSLWEHLHTCRYQVMHLRRRFQKGTLLGCLALKDSGIVGMFSFGPDNFLELKINVREGRLVVDIKDSFVDKKFAELFEKRVGKYINNRVEQERAYRSALDKFSPKYKPAEISR